MNSLPLIYGFRDLVTGDGFLAGITVEGRALIKKEVDGWWCYGVEPGGIAESGNSEAEAYQNFKESIREVLADSAALCSSFKGFVADVEMLGRQVNEAWDSEWQQARQAVRGGQVIEGALADLPRKTGEVRAGIQVVELRKPTPKDNAANTEFSAAA